MKMTICIKRSSNQNFSCLYRSECPSPVDSCFVCHTVAPTSRQWWQRPQLSSTTMYPDKQLNNGPTHQRMHPQHPKCVQWVNWNKYVVNRIAITNSHHPHRCIEHFFDFWRSYVNRSWFTSRSKNRTVFTQCDDYSSATQTQEIIYGTFRFSEMYYFQVNIQ